MIAWQWLVVAIALTALAFIVILLVNTRGWEHRLDVQAAEAQERADKRLAELESLAYDYAKADVKQRKAEKDYAALRKAVDSKMLWEGNKVFTDREMIQAINPELLMRIGQMEARDQLIQALARFITYESWVERIGLQRHHRIRARINLKDVIEGRPPQ